MGLFGNRNWNYHGFNTKTNSWYDENGFDKKGHDENGFDKKGHDENGFNGEGIHKKTKTKFDEDGHEVQFFGKRIKKKGILLEVKAAHPADVDEPIIRIDYDTAVTLQLQGMFDTVEIKGKGKRRTVRKYDVAFKVDEGKGIIRIDAIGRHNSGIEIGDKISIRKIKAVLAEKIVLAPLGGMPPIQDGYMSDALGSVPLTKGDNVRARYFGGRIPFHVLDVTPADDAVLITQKTVFHIDEESSLQFDLTHHKTARHCNMPIYMGQLFCSNCNTSFDWT
jgi:hypothetical protein